MNDLSLFFSLRDLWAAGNLGIFPRLPIIRGTTAKNTESRNQIIYRYKVHFDEIYSWVAVYVRCSNFVPVYAQRDPDQLAFGGGVFPAWAITFAENHHDIQEVTTDTINARAAAEGRLEGNGETHAGDLCTVPEQGTARQATEVPAHKSARAHQGENQAADTNAHLQAAPSQSWTGSKSSRWTIPATSIRSTFKSYWTGNYAAQLQSDTKRGWGERRAKQTPWLQSEAGWRTGQTEEVRHHDKGAWPATGSWQQWEEVKKAKYLPVESRLELEPWRQNNGFQGNPANPGYL